MIFFDSWEGIVRIIVSGVLAYAALIIMLRLSGKRTLSKMNAFDFVITVALGSTLSSVIISKQVPLAEGLLALAMLVGLQMAVSWLSMRWAWFERAIKAEPTLLLHNGEYLEQAMADMRITRSDIDQAIRSEGKTDAKNVRAVVLETNGKLAVLSKDAQA